MERGLKSCHFCEEFLDCEKLSYQKETCRIAEHYIRIKQVGYENWVKEQKEKLKENVDNIYFLE